MNHGEHGVHGKRHKARRLRAVVAVVALVLCTVDVVPIAASPRKVPASPAARRQKRETLKRKLTGVRSRIRQARAEIRSKRREEKEIVDEIDTVEGRLKTTRESLNRAEVRLDDLAEQQAAVEKRIVETEKRLAGRKKILAGRIRQNYQRGSTTSVQVLLRSRTVHEYMSRSYYAQRIADSDARLIDGIKADRALLARDKRALDEQAAETERLKAQREQEQEQLRSDLARRRELLEEVEQERVALERELDQMEDASRDIESEIRALQQTPRGRIRLARTWTGSFAKPADGPITSGFGQRFHPILKRTRMHTGIDIGAGYGATIRAAAAGEVIFAGSRRGYGNCVIIDHGGGVSTLYGHCSSLSVSDGEQVSQGQAIARVGSTGMSTGPHLHFEVRRNGSPVDPR